MYAYYNQHIKTRTLLNIAIAKTPQVSLGNLTDLNKYGLLADIDIQPIDEGPPMHVDKRHDINNFFTMLF